MPILKDNLVYLVHRKCIKDNTKICPQLINYTKNGGQRIVGTEHCCQFTDDGKSQLEPTKSQGEVQSIQNNLDK